MAEPSSSSLANTALEHSPQHSDLFNDATTRGSSASADRQPAAALRSQRKFVLDYIVALPAHVIPSGSSLATQPPPLSIDTTLSPRRSDSGNMSPVRAGYQSSTPASAFLSSRESAQPTPTPTPPQSVPLSVPSASHAGSPIGSARTSPSSRPLFYHSWNEVEPVRCSQRSGRVLTELESLQKKHEAEFKVVVPVVSQALRLAVEAHEELAASHTHLPPPASSSASAGSSERSAPSRSSPEEQQHLSMYDTVAIPTIPLASYVKRIAEFTYVSPATLLASIILIDRLLLKFPALYLSSRNIFKLFFVCVRVASKVLDLRSLNNKNFASVGGVSNKHLNDLEAKLLMDLCFDLFISQEEFVLYARRVFQAIGPSAAAGGAAAMLRDGFARWAIPSAHPYSAGHSNAGQSTSPRTRSLIHVTFAPPPPLLASTTPGNSRRATYQFTDSGAAVPPTDSPKLQR